MNRNESPRLTLRNFDGKPTPLARFLRCVAGVMLLAALSAPELCSAQAALTNATADSPDRWPAVTLPAPRDVELGGPVGEALRRGVARLAQPPYTQGWLLADVSFQVNRIFTNYSGDVSGRFLELAALTSPRGQFAPATFAPVLAEVVKYQKADGHFGLDMDLAQPMKKLSPPIPMLWGNARLLVGLVTAARERHDTNLLAAARRLGDFYVASASQLCSPAREAEFRAIGTYGDGYVCCYFPAIESLALLYRETRDERYLTQARRMAELFLKFDTLPVEHSHGNLCAWRGILEYYDLTGERVWLDRARAKWQAAMQGGYVWPLGGVGEHWDVFFHGDEGCSESDWLRFSLDLWRFTGEPRYLDAAERLLRNQYAANQCPNGGYGWRNVEGDAAGPVATRGAVDEWNFCCSFHGPLGLHFLKAYLAAGSDRGVFVNLPLDFTAPVKAGQREWRVTVKSLPAARRGQAECEIELAPTRPGGSARTTLWLRQPDWASEVKLVSASGAALQTTAERGYVRLERDFGAGEKIGATFVGGLRLEGRRFQRITVEPGRISRLRDAALLDGPDVLFATPAPGPGRLTLLATVDSTSRPGLLESSDGGYLTAALPGLDLNTAQIAAALDTARPVILQPWPAVKTRRRVAFMHDLLVVPAESLPARAIAGFTERARQTAASLAGPVFGDRLETQPDLWGRAEGWRFTTNGLQVTSGDIGLLEGEGYADYRFEFDLELPPEGQGITGWVVRADSADDCLMFQLQSGDSPYDAPQFKTRPNTLRPHIRHQAQWTISDPVPLPKPVRRGETHHIAVECRAHQIIVFLDGAKIHTQDDAGLRSGTVGFRAAGPAEQGRFRHVLLRKL